MTTTTGCAVARISTVTSFTIYPSAKLALASALAEAGERRSRGFVDAGGGGAAAAAGSSAGAGAGAASPAAAADDGVARLSIRELKRKLAELGGSDAGITERHELVAAVRKAAAAAPSPLSPSPTPSPSL